jgi:hypothetical protein
MAPAVRLTAALSNQDALRVFRWQPWTSLPRTSSPSPSDRRVSGGCTSIRLAPNRVLQTFPQQSSLTRRPTIGGTSSRSSALSFSPPRGTEPRGFWSSNPAIRPTEGPRTNAGNDGPPGFERPGGSVASFAQATPVPKGGNAAGPPFPTSEKPGQKLPLCDATVNKRLRGPGSGPQPNGPSEPQLATTVAVVRLEVATGPVRSHSLPSQGLSRSRSRYGSVSGRSRGFPD